MASDIHHLRIAREKSDAAVLLRQRRESIMKLWESRAVEHIRASGRQSLPQLRDHLPVFLDAMAVSLDTSEEYGARKIKLASQQHGDERASNDDYCLAEVVAEYKILRTTTMDVLEADRPVSYAARLVIHEAFDDAILDATVAFVERTAKRDRDARIEFERQALDERGLLIAAFRTASAPTAVLRASDMTFEFVNLEYARVFGNRDYLGRTFTDVFSELAGTGIVEEVEAVARTGCPVKRDELAVHIRRDAFNGLRLGYYTYTVTAYCDSAGIPQGLLIMALDVTEPVLARKNVESAKAALDVERANFRALFKQTKSLVCILSGPQHVFEFVNDAHVHLLGFDATGMSVREAQPESVEVHGILDGVYRTGATAELVEIPITVGNSVKWFDLTYSARRDSLGIVDGIMILGAEITDRVLVAKSLESSKQAAESANEAKSAFLANMSHEIRTPLGAVIGFAGLLTQQSLPREELTQYASIIARNSTQLLRIIDDILDLSKVEAGQMSVESLDFSLHELLHDFASFMSLRASEKAVEFVMTIDPHAPNRMRGDPTRIRQILMNVIGNAIKFTEHGRVALSVVVKGDMLELSVTDTGRGISAEQAARLFQPFAQADESTTRKYGGTGLGLVLTKRLCELQGGEFFLKHSELGVGSEFVARVRFAPALEARLSRDATVPSQSLFRALTPQDSRKQRVLLVEDSPDNQALMKILLLRAGADVDVASDGIEGVEKAMTGEYALILMDVQMPRMDGHEATRILRASGYRGPIVALTAHAMKEERVRCLASGFSDFLSKPVEKEALQSMLNRTRGASGETASPTISK